MTRIAFFTDVHADLPALQAALAEIDRMGCDLILCGGDLVSYDVFPNEVIAHLRDRGIPCVRGNHDVWAVHGQLGDARRGADPMGLGLTRDNQRWLSRLPTSWRGEVDGRRVVVWHARPGSDMLGVERLAARSARQLLDDADADVLLLGHTHQELVKQVAPARIIANPGALWRGPRDSPPSPWLLNPDTGKFTRRSGAGTYRSFGVLDLGSGSQGLTWKTVRIVQDGADGAGG